MTVKTIVMFLGNAALSAFLISSCGKSSAPEQEAARDHASHDHAGEPAKAAPAPEPVPAPEPKPEAAAKPIRTGLTECPPREPTPFAR